MQDIRKSPEYQRWRREVRHRDENTCRICAVQRNLHVHHIKPLEKYTEFATDIDNGITLCGNCHTFLSGREENTNLQTIIEAFTGQQDVQITEQLKRLNDKFCVYLESLLKSEDRDIVSDAVYKMFVHLQIYPDSLDQFLHFIEHILSSEKGFEDRFSKQIAIETVKNHPSKTASEILSKYETSCNYQDGKSAYLQGDYATALKKFEPLAESGHIKSQHYLGVIYEEGRGVTKDAKAAIKWYLKAAERGHTEAQRALGLMYTYGSERNDTKAIKWFTKVAEQGDASAISILVNNYAFADMYVGRGVALDDTEAIKWCTKLLEMGYSSKQFCILLGDIYVRGRGVQQDYTEAIKWYTEAGTTQGIVRIGEMYEFGRGVARDYAEAIKWYTEAAECGEPTAYSRLGGMYARGRGVERDGTEAIKWYLKAVQQGNEDARLDFERLYANRKTTRLKIDKDTLQEPYRPKYGNSTPFSQEPYWTRLSFFDSLSAEGIRLFLPELSELGYYSYVKIEIKDKRFTLEVRGSEPLSQSGSLNSIFDEGLESEHSQPNSSEAYPQLKGEVFLTEEDIPTLRILLINILTR